MHTIDYFINWSFLLYFVILFAERLQSLIRTFTKGTAAAFGSPFSSYVNVLAIASLAASLILLVGFNGGFFKALFGGSSEINYTMLCITAGVMLLSGMVHTEFTIAPIQFGAYGMLILSMILKTTTFHAQSASPFLLWFSVAYLTVFSMAIPVMYRSQISNAVLFHIIEAVVSIALVVAFTFMLRQVFIGQGDNLFYIVPIIIAAVGDAAIIIMRWKEEVNWFVLIFASLAVVMWAIGKIIAAVTKTGM